MLHNYLRVALRNLRKYPLFSAINLFGLSLSLSVGFMLLLILSDQLSYDKHYPDGHRLYRVQTHRAVAAGIYQGSVDEYATSPPALFERLEQDLSGIEAVTYLCDAFTFDAVAGDKTLRLEGAFASPNLLTTFDMPLAYGNPYTALTQPNSLVLTHDDALRLFGRTDVVGQVVTIRQLPRSLRLLPTYDSLSTRPDPGLLGNLTVTGVLAKDKRRSHLSAIGSFVPYSTYQAWAEAGTIFHSAGSWTSTNDHYTYVKLSQGTSPQAINQALQAYEEQARNDEISLTFNLHPVTQIIPSDDISNEVAHSLPSIVLYILMGFAGLVLLASAFNYAHLTSARAVTRAREVGVRKVNGAKPRQLIAQFLSESLLLAAIAGVLGVLGLYFLVPAFMSTLPPEASGVFNFNPPTKFFVWAVLLVFAMGLLAGVGPALFMSRINTVKALKNLKIFSRARRFGLRQVLVVAQFGFSMLFIVVSVSIMRQMRYAVNADLGFATQNILTVELQGGNLDAFRQQFASHPDVQNITGISHILGANSSRSFTAYNDSQTDSLLAYYFDTDAAFFQTFQLELLAGSGFPTDVPDGPIRYAVINERMATRLGYAQPEQAVGQTIFLHQKDRPVTVTGVIQDIHYLSLFNAIEPFAIRLAPTYTTRAALAISSKDMPATIASLEEKWKAYNPVQPFEYQFYDDTLQQAYGVLRFFGSVVGFVAFLAISIAGLALLGMATYTAERRRKEVGIRKVLGATRLNLLLTLSRSFGIMLLIACFVGLPLAWFISNLLLDNFAYRINLGPGIYIMAVGLVLAIGLLSVGSQAFRASRLNPVNMLRED